MVTGPRAAEDPLTSLAPGQPEPQAHPTLPGLGAPQHPAAGGQGREAPDPRRGLTARRRVPASGAVGEDAPCVVDPRFAVDRDPLLSSLRALGRTLLRRRSRHHGVARGRPGAGIQTSSSPGIGSIGSSPFAFSSFSRSTRAPGRPASRLKPTRVRSEASRNGAPSRHLRSPARRRCRSRAEAVRHASRRLRRGGCRHGGALHERCLRPNRTRRQRSGRRRCDLAAAPSGTRMSESLVARR